MTLKHWLLEYYEICSYDDPRVLEYHQVCSNNDLGLTLTFLTTGSNLVLYVFVKDFQNLFKSTISKLVGTVN